LTYSSRCSRRIQLAEIVIFTRKSKQRLVLFEGKSRKRLFPIKVEECSPPQSLNGIEYLDFVRNRRPWAHQHSNLMAGVAYRQIFEKATKWHAMLPKVDWA